MARPVPDTARAQIEQTVEHKHTLNAHNPQLPPVLSTPHMIGLMEIACFQALQPFADDGEINVGTAIHVEHRAATTIGAKVTAEAVMDSFDGRFYTMRVRAWDERQEIGSGTVGRAFVNVKKFMDRLQKNPAK